MLPLDKYEELAEHYRLLKEQEPRPWMRSFLESIENSYRGVGRSSSGLPKTETLRSWTPIGGDRSGTRDL
jgi:hypothetical protein